MNMRTIITLLLVTLTIGATAQTQDSMSVMNDSVSVNSENTMRPLFPGGEKALRKFLEKNLTYPDLAEQYGVEGTVVMSFAVEKDGALKEITAKDCKIERFNATAFSKETDAKQIELKKQFALLFAKEGARVIRKMPKWVPGRWNGQVVRMKCNLPLHFFDPNK